MKLITLLIGNMITVPHCQPGCFPPCTYMSVCFVCVSFQVCKVCMSCPSAGIQKKCFDEVSIKRQALHMPCLSIKAFNQGELHERQEVFQLLLCVSLLSHQTGRDVRWYSVKPSEFLFILSPHVEGARMKADAKLGAELTYSLYSV